MGDESPVDIEQDIKQIKAHLAYLDEAFDQMKLAIEHIQDLLKSVEIWSPPDSVLPGSAAHTLTTSQGSCTTVCSRGSP